MAITRKAFSIIFISILVLTVILLQRFFINRSPFGNDNSSFSIDAQKVISKIIMTCGDKELVIKNDNGSWSVNGISEVSKSTITTFIELLTSIQIKSPVSESVFDDVIVKQNVVPVKVKVFVKNRVNRTFLVYRTGSNIYGNIMKTSEKAKPFIVYAPGFDTNTGSYFDPDERSWLPFTIFTLRPSEINSIEVRYRDDELSSFIISRSSDRYRLTGAGETGNIDSLKVMRYLSYYIYIPFEKWAFDLSEEEKNKIFLNPPAITIDVSTNTGKKYSLSVWNMWSGSGDELEIDTDRVWGRLNGSEDIFVIRYFDIDPILKKRGYFVSR